MPRGPFAHVCFLVNDLDLAIQDWRKILAVVDPEQLEQPIVKMESATGTLLELAYAYRPEDGRWEKAY